MINIRGFLPPCNSEYSEWNREEQQETVHHLLQFMTNQYEAFDKYFPSFHDRTMLHFFIFNENYESHLKIFLGLASRSTALSDDYKFVNYLKKVFYSSENHFEFDHFINGRIEKVLIILRELNRPNLLIQLYSIILAIEPESFQNIYEPLPLEGDSIGKDVTDLKILME
jgi:hypothetical protein